MWDFAILHGDFPFTLNWAYETNIGMFSASNPGAQFINSRFYLMVLCSVLIQGLANSMKRTTVAMFLGKRIFGTTDMSNAGSQ